MRTLDVAGVDRAAVDDLLEGDGGLDALRAGEEQARRLGVSGVPFFVVSGLSWRRSADLCQIG